MIVGEGAAMGAADWSAWKWVGTKAAIVDWEFRLARLRSRASDGSTHNA
jgi:hypothetical protein